MLIKILSAIVIVLSCMLFFVFIKFKRCKTRFKKMEIFLDALVEIQKGVLKSGALTGFHKKILEILGLASKACRVYIFTNSIDLEGNLLMTQIAEWCDTGVSAQINNSELQNLPYKPSFSRWVNILKSGDFIAGLTRTFPNGEKVILSSQDIKCILILPLIVKSEFYGFIGFDNTKNEREWTREEIGLLQSSAASISLDIERYLSKVEKDDALIEAKKANAELYEAYDEVKAINCKMESVQKKLSLANEELEGAVISVTESSRAKSQFLALMSHEIRTPLTSIIGYCELLLHDKKLNEEQKSYVNKIFNSGEGLLLLLNDLLELSAIEAGKIKIKITDFELTELIKQVAEPFKISAQNKNIDFFINAPEYSFTYSDKLRLGQILSNLLSNAVKFTQDGGRIIISLKKDENDFVFSVEDTGIGIDEDDRGIVFDIFRQIESPYKKGKTGSGLGLAVCKKLVKLLNGRIWLESAVGKGSTFYFSIPAIQEIPECEKQSESDMRQKKEIEDINCRILFAEDDLSTFQLLENILSMKKGIIYKGFTDGVYLYKEFKNNRGYDIILLDIQMSNMSGIDTFNKIRKLDADIPIIAMTAFAMEHDEKKFIDLGFSSYISKPISIDKFLETISEICNNDNGESRGS